MKELRQNNQLSVNNQDLLSEMEMLNVYGGGMLGDGGNGYCPSNENCPNNGSCDSNKYCNENGNCPSNESCLYNHTCGGGGITPHYPNEDCND
jgi:hypothetical protein